MTSEDYLLDTNVCIAIRDLLAGRVAKSPERQERIEKLKARWSQVPAERLAMSAITLGELRFGANKSKASDKAHALLEQVMAAVKVLVIDDTVAQHYGEVRAALETSPAQPIDANDTWIASHGRATGRVVVTNDHAFARVPGLRHEDWTA
jgi:tRNA(fMet)-specific endonuclease VapC